MAEKSAATEEQGDEGMGFLTQLKTFTDGFMKLRNNKDKMSKTIEEQEKKIHELEIETEKKSAELKAIKEERRQLLTDLERSRFEVVRLNEENVSLKRELEKLGVTSGKTPDKRVTRKSKNKDKEKNANPDDALPPDLTPEGQLVGNDQTETTNTSELNGTPATPQRKSMPLAKGMAIVYKKPDSQNSDYKTSIPLEVLQQEATKGKDLDKCREVSETGVVDGNFEQAGSISVVVEEYIGPDVGVNAETSVSEQVNNPETEGTISVVVEEYVAPDNSVSATVNSLVDETVANSESGQNQEAYQNMETEQTNMGTEQTNMGTEQSNVETEQRNMEAEQSRSEEGNKGANPNEVADKNAGEDNDEVNSKENKGESTVEETPTNTRTTRSKSARKSSMKKKGKKGMPSESAVENSQTETNDNDKTSKETIKDNDQTIQDNYQTPRTRSRRGNEKETFLSNMNLSSSKQKMKIRLRSSPRKDGKTYPARSGRKRKAASLDNDVPEKNPAQDSEKDPEKDTEKDSKKDTEKNPEREAIPQAEQGNDFTNLKTPSSIKSEKLIPKTESDLSMIYNFDMEENMGKEQTEGTPGPDIIVDPVTEEDFQGVYFCSECNIGFKNESIFNRHIQFRHGGAGLPSELPADFKSHAGVKILQSGVKIPISHNISENGSLTENMQADGSEQTSLQNGGTSVDGESPYDIPNLKKEFPRPLLLVKREQGPPVLKKEGSAEPEPKTPKRHVCLLCDKRFASGVGLRAHMNKHNGVRPYECTICHMSFFAKSDRNKHVKITHEAVKNHFCLICGKGFTTQVYLNHHLSNHSQERKFGCEECGKRFKQKPHLDKHIQLIHRNERTHICTTCGKAFGTSYSLKSHQAVHTGEKAFTCDTCGKSFGNKGYLLKHQMYHTGDKKYMCIHCKKCFYLSTDLQRHMMIHNNEKLFACTKCEYRTNMKANLKVHMLTHSGIRYKCSICGKKLTSKSSLVKHSQLHEEMPVYDVTDPAPQQQTELGQEQTEIEQQEPEFENQIEMEQEQSQVPELEHQPVELMQEAGEPEYEDLTGELDQGEGQQDLEPEGEGQEDVELQQTSQIHQDQEQAVEVRQEVDLDQEQLGQLEEGEHGEKWEMENEEPMEHESDQNRELEQGLGSKEELTCDQDFEEPDQDNYSEVLTVPVDQAVASAQ